MTRTSSEIVFTDLDIMLLRAGAPTRFDSPYWTERKVDWSVVRDVFISPVTRLIRAGFRMIPCPQASGTQAA